MSFSFSSLFGNNKNNSSRITEKVDEIQTTFAQIGAIVSEIQKSDQTFQKLFNDHLESQANRMEQMGNSIRSTIGTLNCSP
jgi:DNA anti-recombination protein RmuC